MGYTIVLSETYETGEFMTIKSENTLLGDAGNCTRSYSISGLYSIKSFFSSPGVKNQTQCYAPYLRRRYKFSYFLAPLVTKP